MQSGDLVKFNSNVRPRYLEDIVVQVIAVSEFAAAIKVPQEGFPGDSNNYWKPGSVFLAPLNFIDLHQKKGASK